VAARALTRVTYLDLTYQGQPVRFAKTEIDQARHYGLRKLVAIDAQGRECETAILLAVRARCCSRWATRGGTPVALYGQEKGLTERALGHADPSGDTPARFRPSDSLLAFLQSL
jgi:hypothetical protein